MRRKNFLGTLTLVFIGIVFGAVLVSGFGWVRPSYGSIEIGADKPPVEMLNADASAFNNAFIEVADKVTSSIVQIEVVAEIKNRPQSDLFHFFTPPFRNDMPEQQKGGGSGIIISDDGYILTNNHVVEDAKTVTVTLHDKRRIEAQVIGTDPSTDLAVIKVDYKGLPEAYLGDSDKLKVGTWVMAIGNPLSLSSTVTAGIVSALNRGQLNLVNNKNGTGIESFIQTDAAINPGNSGGALVDLNGAVVGVNSAIATQTGTYIGYGFAIPINLAKSVAKDLIANGKVIRGYIGVQISEVDAATAKAIGLEEPKGVMVQSIVDGGAASKEDIKVGDVILKIDEKETNQSNELQTYVASKRAGTKVRLTIYRDEKTIERYVTLKANDEKDTKTVATKDFKGKGTDVDSKEVNFENLGMSVRNMNSDELKAYKLENGVIITNIKQFGRASNQRLFEGAVIVSADRKEINSVSELQSAIDNKKGKALLLKLVDKEGTSRLVGLDIPK